jgi:hypothetical protein
VWICVVAALCAWAEIDIHATALNASPMQVRFMLKRIS